VVVPTGGLEEAEVLEQEGQKEQVIPRSAQWGERAVQRLALEPSGPTLRGWAHFLSGADGLKIGMEDIVWR
jgi:hypothetical protein